MNNNSDSNNKNNNNTKYKNQYNNALKCYYIYSHVHSSFYAQHLFMLQIIIQMRGTSLFPTSSLNSNTTRTHILGPSRHTSSIPFFLSSYIVTKAVKALPSTATPFILHCSFQRPISNARPRLNAEESCGRFFRCFFPPSSTYSSSDFFFVSETYVFLGRNVRKNICIR